MNVKSIVKQEFQSNLKVENNVSSKELPLTKIFIEDLQKNVNVKHKEK